MRVGGMEISLPEESNSPTKKLCLSIFTPDMGASRWEMEGQMWALDLCGGKPSSPHSQLPFEAWFAPSGRKGKQTLVGSWSEQTGPRTCARGGLSCSSPAVYGAPPSCLAELRAE